VRFEWDPKKAVSNRLKHGVGFEESASSFNDPEGRIFEDPEHSANEKREILIGTSELGRILLTAFTERSSTIRIISSRRANRKEKQRYEEFKASSTRQQ
jgi:uncharacterized DUF497 family protein